MRRKKAERIAAQAAAGAGRKKDFERTHTDEQFWESLAMPATQGASTK